MLWRMVTPASGPAPAPSRPSWLKRLATKILTLVLLGLLLGIGYDWAVPRLYKPGAVAGFRIGMVHGALMPVALPALLVGRDVPIFLNANPGRIYKLGYIAGINLCGLVFFGLAFRRPQKV
jgi:hypothetical protein